MERPHHHQKTVEHAPPSEQLAEGLLNRVVEHFLETGEVLFASENFEYDVLYTVLAHHIDESGVASTLVMTKYGSAIKTSIPSVRELQNGTRFILKNKGENTSFENSLTIIS